jgi:double-stranded uracil-DNA glycosylase
MIPGSITSSQKMASLDAEFFGPSGESFLSLPDYLAPGLRLLSVGLNPSINSVKAGYYFATRTNRFWKALNASELIDQEITPGKEGIQQLFDGYQMGFTDVVKRPTPGASDLRAADFRYWSPILEQKIRDSNPELAWFHGKVAYQQFLKATGRDGAGIEWGEQPLVLGGSRIYVTPNPSPANAVFSLQNLVDAYNKLCAVLRDCETDTRLP